jgi:hypothetical protein
MTTIPLTSREGRFDRVSTVLLGAAVVLVVVDAVLPLILGTIADALYYVLTVLAFAGSTAAGAVLLRDPRYAGLGRLLLGVAAAGAVWDLCGWVRDVGPFGFLEGIVYWAWAGMLAHLAVRWPDDRITGRIPRVLVLAVYLLLPVLTLLWQVTWDAQWFEQPGGWWLTLVPARTVSDVAYTTGQVAFAVVIAALVVVLIARVVTARGTRRAAMLPVVVVVVVLAAAVIADLLKTLGVPLAFDTALPQSLALLAIPVAVLVAALRRPAADAEPGIPGRRRALG